MVLAIEGSKFQFNFQNPKDEEKFIINGSTILLSSTDTTSTALNHKEATSMVIWDCSLILARFLEKYFKELEKSERRFTCLEVGAGLGLVGISCSKFPTFQQIIITDIPAAIPHLRASIELNNCGKSTSAVALDWLSYEESDVYDYLGKGNQPDFIVAADVIWVLDLIEPLINCLSYYSGPHTKVIIAHQTRSCNADQYFFSFIAKSGFQILQQITKKDEKENVSIYILIKSK